MPVDIRATVSCSLGTVISGNVNDEYVQGTGLIKCSGTVLINGIITPAIGTAVTFSYTKAGVTRSIPRKLRVLSSFADPFRRTTSVELGCKLTYLSDKRDSIDWTAFDDDENTLTEDDAEIITIPIRAQAVAKKCMDELGISGSLTLTNKFSVAEFDLSPGYVQVLSDLLVSESLCGYLDANETLQVFSLDQAGGTGPVLDATQLVDISKIGVGQLPGEAVVVSYNSLKLKRDVDQGGETGGSRWESETTTNRNNVIIPYQFTQGGTVFFDSKQYNILETSTTTTYFKVIKTKDGPKRVVDYRQSTFTTGSASVLGGLASEYLNNGINFTNIPIAKTVTETYEYDGEGNEVRIERVTKGSSYYITGSLGVPFVFPDSYVILSSKIILLARETTTREIAGGVQKETTINYGPWHTTISGQQTIAASRDSFSSASEVVAFMNGLGIGNLGLLDVRVSINRKGPPAVSVDQATVNNANNAKGGDPNNGYRTESKAELELALGSATAQRRIELSLPYAPDDTFSKSGSTYSSVESDAAAKAQLYGRVQNRLLLGNRNGMNIQVAPEILPGSPFSPFIIRSGSTSALYRTNGTNWTFDASGLVASTDALFWGGVGGNAGESWFPIAPGITTLPTTPGTTTVNIVDGNGNVIGSYEQMVVPGTVPVAQETRLLQATLRLRPVVTGLDYALEQEAEITATTKVQAVITSIKAMNVPPAAVTLAGLAPAVSTGARVAVPAAAVSLAGVAPTVASGASVAVPAAGVGVAGVVPDLVGRQRTQLLVPATGVSVAGLAPSVATGVLVAVPAAGLTVAALAPAQIVPAYATGGTETTITVDGITYRVHTFTTVGTSSLTVLSGGEFEYLVIAGGGGGSGGSRGAGGGAGGYRCSVSGESSGGGAAAESPLVLAPGSYTVVVGDGGAGNATYSNVSTADLRGTTGGNSQFATITANGGGGGGAADNTASGRNGGSGGGAWFAGSGGTGITGQGFQGGTAGTSGVFGGGGGGGAGGAGGNGSSTAPGNGGAGVTSSITGTAVTRAGGGAGANYNTATSGTASGGGGLGRNNSPAGQSVTNGAANTGGGGGAGGGKGGSGVVIVRYRIG